MNKKILSLAVAAAMAAPLAAQADVTVYGDINMDVSSVNTHTASDYYTWPVGKFFANPSMNCGVFHILPRNFIPCVSIPGSRGNIYMSDNAWELNSNNSRIGFKGTEDLGNGLSAIWGIELQVDVAGDGSLGLNHNNVLSTAGGPADLGTRNMFLGLSSAQFGTVVAGKHDTPYKIMFNSYDKFAETMADDDQLMKGATPNRALIGEFNGQDTQGFADRRASNAIAYVSPTFAGVTVAGAVVPAELNSDSGVFSNGAGWSLAGNGVWGPIQATLGYEILNDLKLNRAIDTGFGWNPLTWATFNTAPYLDSHYRDDDALWGAGLAYSGGPFYLGVRYEDRTGVDYIKDYDIKQWRVTGTYAFGNNVLKAVYHRLDGSTPSYDFGGDYTGDAWGVGVDHNFSKRTKIYALYTHLNWNIDSHTGLGRLNVLPLVGGGGVGGALIAPVGLMGGGFGQPTLLDNETFSIGMQHLF